MWIVSKLKNGRIINPVLLSGEVYTLLPCAMQDSKVERTKFNLLITQATLGGGGGGNS